MPPVATTSAANKTEKKPKKKGPPNKGRSSFVATLPPKPDGFEETYAELRDTYENKARTMSLKYILDSGWSFVAVPATLPSADEDDVSDAWQLLRDPSYSLTFPNTCSGELESLYYNDDEDLRNDITVGYGFVLDNPLDVAPLEEGKVREGVWKIYVWIPAGGLAVSPPLPGKVHNGMQVVIRTK